MAIEQTLASECYCDVRSGQEKNMTVTPEAIMATVTREANLDPGKVRLDSTLESLDIASLDLISILFALEDEFGVEIAPEEVERSWTIAQFAEHVASLPSK